MKLREESLSEEDRMNLKVLRKVSYGMYVVTSFKDDKVNGQIANTVFQITSEPPTIAISINKGNLTHEYIESSKSFAVSILSNDVSIKLIGQFGFKSGRDIDKFEGIKTKTFETKSPVILDSSIGYIEAKVINSLDMGSHTLFIGEIINTDVFNNEEPMTYAYYHEVKNGKSPKNAPTYINEEKQENKEDNKMKKYVCTVCGYVYDPEKGDPDSGIAPGTEFEDIPDDWVCPVCGVSKSDFEEM